MNEMVFKINDQIKTVKDGFKHVVIIGAGASKASCDRNPEKNGNKIPLMNNLPKIIDLKEELKDINNKHCSSNFEILFSELYKQEKNSKRLKNIEQKIYDYFSNLKLPNNPTIYDYLILSLRSKDLIASFNWDPFLWQAYERNIVLTKNLPQIAFLHGNVAIGICDETKTFGPIGNGYYNKLTGEPYKPTKLLYPIEEKNYNSDPYIKDQWQLLSYFLKSPARVTIFGYSAPDTDVEAILTLKKAFGKKETHSFTQFEIIDIRDEEKLYELWDDFIFSHHYEIHKDYFDSTLAKFPRRTGEVFEENYINAKWYEENKPIKTNDFEEFWKWHQSLIENE